MQPTQILLLDPATGGRQLLARLFRMSGFGVVEAATDDQARMAALTRQFDLLITEISTSDCAEFSLNELLSRLHGTRGIVLTAHDPKEVPGWRKAGFASLYRKPVDFDCLLAGVKQLAVGVRHHRWDSLNLRPAGPQVERALYNGTQAGRLMASMGTN